MAKCCLDVLGLKDYAMRCTSNNCVIWSSRLSIHAILAFGLLGLIQKSKRTSKKQKQTKMIFVIRKSGSGKVRHQGKYFVGRLLPSGEPSERIIHQEDPEANRNMLGGQSRYRGASFRRYTIG